MGKSKDITLTRKVRDIFIRKDRGHKLTSKQREKYMFNFNYDTREFKTCTAYVAYWLELIGMNVYFTSTDNGDLLAMNVGKGMDNYIIYPSFNRGRVIPEEEIAKIEEKQDKLKAIPVIISWDEPDSFVSTIAVKRGIQLINASQITGLNKMILFDTIPENAGKNSSFINQIADYVRVKIS